MKGEPGPSPSGALQHRLGTDQGFRIPIQTHEPPTGADGSKHRACMTTSSDRAVHHYLTGRQCQRLQGLAHKDGHVQRALTVALLLRRPRTIRGHVDIPHTDRPATREVSGCGRTRRRQRYGCSAAVGPTRLLSENSSSEVVSARADSHLDLAQISMVWPVPARTTSLLSVMPA